MNLYKMKTMKRYLLMLALLLGTICSYAQNTTTDYVVLDQSAPNLAQLKTQFAGQSNVFINDNTKPAPYLIPNIMVGKQVADLHIYVSTQPGVIYFNSITITPANAVSFSEEFALWNDIVSGNVVLHSADVFTSPQGATLKTTLQQLTGLNFITQ